MQITSDIELSGAGCTTAITPNQLVQSSSENDTCLHNQDRSLPRSAGDSRRCRSNRASPVRHGIDNDDQERRQAEGGKAICLLALYPISDSSLCVARHTTTKKVRKAKMLAMLPKQAQWAVAGALAVFIVAGAGSLAALVLN